MRAYREADEEALRARSLLKDWVRQGFLTEAQYRRMEQETPCDLRRTNIFLRLVLFFFTLIIVAAAVALFFTTFLQRTSWHNQWPFFLAFAGIAYTAAEVAVSRARFYRHGVEEALAACSVVFLCVGLEGLLTADRPYSPAPFRMDSFVPATGALLSLWIWHRFGLAYAFLAAMIFVPWIPGYWTSSHPAQHLIVVAIYSIGLTVVIEMRTPHRFTHLDENFSIAEALLWLGIYLAINLQISSLNMRGAWWNGAPAATEFPPPFYWTTWVLTWCLPPAVLTRGIRAKDRWVIAAGLATAILTLITNKPYLGWPRHTWDPMLLGAVLIAATLYVRRWLSGGDAGIRSGFTAQRLSGKDKAWLSAGTTALGFVSPEQITHTQPAESEFRFGGGDSGGGGASSDF
jgi:uncharacterized membrane protein YgcG